MKHFSLVDASDCEDNCVRECEVGWEEEGGKCYFFSQDSYTWVAAEMECKRNYDSHLASVTDQKTGDFIAGKLTIKEVMWIGANRQTFETEKGRWAWADGCSPWNHTSWDKRFDPDGVREYECAICEMKSFQNISRWRATKCDDTRIQFRYVCSKSICSNETNIMPSVDPITISKIVREAGATTIIMGTIIAILLLLLVMGVAILTIKALKKRQREAKPMKTEENSLYGQYYNTDGERIDQGRVYAEDQNLYYYES